MSTDSTNTEPTEEVVDLFAKGFDDKSLLDDEQEDGASGNGVEGTTDAGEGAGGESTIPDKYQGKSITEVIDMHQNLERAYGRHNNELGELRQLTDQILKQQLGEATSDSTDELDQDDLLSNPADAINRQVENNPRLKAIEARIVATERADKLATFKRTHPDAGQVVNDPRFLEWVQRSPTRVRLLQEANTNYDYELAGEMLNTFSELSGTASTEASDTAKGKLKNAAPGATGGKSGGKKVVYFKRSELMRLKQEDPDRYEKLQPQILDAYANGRVR